MMKPMSDKAVRKVWLVLVLACVALLVLCLGVNASALAETSGGGVATAFDATPIVAAAIVLIGTALGAVLLWLTYKYIVPLLKVPIVGTLARWAVDMAEQALGSGNGEAKFAKASAFITGVLATLHIKVDADQITAAIMSAWTALNLDQIKAGIKAVTDTSTQTGG